MDTPHITRTLRAAIRLGEDFITVEEQVSLPCDATDDDIARAVELGQRIYAAQRAAVEQQVAAIRSAGPAPTSGGASYTPAPRPARPATSRSTTSPPSRTRPAGRARTWPARSRTGAATRVL